jgi:hypothetical protein
VHQLGGPDLSISDELLGQLRDLMTDTQDDYGIFPTYDVARLRALLAPAHAGARFPPTFNARADSQILAPGLGHDVLTYVATQDGQMITCLFGHRLPWLGSDGEAEDTWLVRVAYFRGDLGAFRRADVVQRCAEAAAADYGIRRVLFLRRAGLGERFFSRFVLGARRQPDRLTLHYIPLSESALAEEAVLQRRLPVGYV